MRDPRIVMLSSVNVGRSNRIANQDLAKALVQIGFPDARPVMQSGNLIIEAGASQSDRELEEVVERGLQNVLALETHAFANRASALGERISSQPWNAPTNRIHLFLHKRRIGEEALDKLNQALRGSEELSFADDHFWLHAPDGLARSRIAARAAALVGQPVTARSLSSLGKIVAAAGGSVPT